MQTMNTLMDIIIVGIGDPVVLVVAVLLQERDALVYFGVLLYVFLFFLLHLLDAGG
jgi:hypothetical protein